MDRLTALAYVIADMAVAIEQLRSALEERDKRIQLLEAREGEVG